MARKAAATSLSRGVVASNRSTRLPAAQHCRKCASSMRGGQKGPRPGTPVSGLYSQVENAFAMLPAQRYLWGWAKPSF